MQQRAPHPKKYLNGAQTPHHRTAVRTGHPVLRRNFGDIRPAANTRPAADNRSLYLLAHWERPRPVDRRPSARQDPHVMQGDVRVP